MRARFQTCRAGLVPVVLIAALTLPPVAAAATPGRVDMVQPPASVERDGRREPLAPGMAVRGGDVVRTGQHSRARLALAEGSDVKVGSDAEVDMQRLDTADESSSGFFEGLVSVVRGAFRYTTGAVAARTTKRHIDFRVGAVTAGIRGTDIWGMAGLDRDFVVLLEGKIDVGSGGRHERLAQAGTAYVKPHSGAAQPRVRVDRATIRRYAQQTEPLANQPTLSADGGWVVHLDSLRDAGRASRALERYRGAGYPVDRERVRVGGAQWYRISLHGLDTRAGARRIGRRFARRFGVRGSWVEHAARGSAQS